MTMTTLNSGRPQNSEWEADHRVIAYCRECKTYPANIVDEFSSGDTVCADCGLVLGERIVDTRSEWRTFSNDNRSGPDPSRVGDAANPLLNGAQLETKIQQKPGHSGSALQRAQSKINESSSNRSLLGAYADIGAYCEAIQITQHVCTTAKSLYKLVSDKKAIRKRPQSAIIAGCIFIACRQCNVPRTFAEIFALTKVPKKEIGRTFKFLEKFFSANGTGKTTAKTKPGTVIDQSNQYSTTTATTAHSLMIRFCNNLDLGPRATTIAEEIARRVAENDLLAGRSTLSCSGAIVFIVSRLVDNKKSIEAISEIVGAGEGTIWAAYKKLYESRELIIDPEWVKKYGGRVELLEGL